MYCLLKDGNPVYVGSTVYDADYRVRSHRKAKRWIATWNPALARFLAEGIPDYKELAVVPDDERFETEAHYIRELGKRHKLLNQYWNGFSHSEKTRAKISLGLRRYHANRPRGISPALSHGAKLNRIPPLPEAHQRGNLPKSDHGRAGYSAALTPLS